MVNLKKNVQHLILKYFKDPNYLVRYINYILKNPFILTSVLNSKNITVYTVILMNIILK